MNENKDIIIDSLCSTIKTQDKLIKSLEGEIEYYKVRIKELEGIRNA